MEAVSNDLDETSFVFLKYETSETETTRKVCHMEKTVQENIL
jgi:hypothetical protein